MRFLIFILFLLFSVPAWSWSTQLHIASEHASGCDTCNERNYGIGFIRDRSIDWVGGYYTNSWFRDSFYIGANFKFIDKVISVSTVGISGYIGTSEKVDKYSLFGELMPIPLIHWTVFPNSSVSPMITYAPTTDGGVTLLSINLREEMFEKTLDLTIHDKFGVIERAKNR